jgi:hypothetical protein
MPARVNLNVPPRLIESARAAQYANREALDGRALTEKIRAKAQARRAAVLRQQSGVAPDRGDDSPPGRDPLKWRIWRKRRPLGRRITYTIEGVRDFDVIGDGTGAITATIVDEWTIYAEWDGYEKQVWAKLYHVDNRGSGFETVPRSAMYISTFIDPQSGDESPPLISYVRYGGFAIIGGPFAGNIAIVMAMTLENPIPFDDFPETTTDNFGRLINSAIIPASGTDLLAAGQNPLHAWTPGGPSSATLGYPFIYGVTAANPLANEYDISRIELAPGYDKTSSLALTEERSYGVSIIVKP